MCQPHTLSHAQVCTVVSDTCSLRMLERSFLFTDLFTFTLHIEQANVVVTYRLTSSKYDVRFLPRTPAVLAEMLRGFPKSLETNGGIVPGLTHERRLSDRFQSIARHHLIQRIMFLDSDSVVK